MRKDGGVGWEKEEEQQHYSFSSRRWWSRLGMERIPSSSSSSSLFPVLLYDASRRKSKWREPSYSSWVRCVRCTFECKRKEGKETWRTFVWDMKKESEEDEKETNKRETLRVENITDSKERKKWEWWAILSVTLKRSGSHSPRALFTSYYLISIGSHSLFSFILSSLPFPLLFPSLAIRPETKTLKHLLFTSRSFNDSDTNIFEQQVSGHTRNNEWSLEQRENKSWGKRGWTKNESSDAFGLNP